MLIQIPISGRKSIPYFFKIFSISRCKLVVISQRCFRDGWVYNVGYDSTLSILHANNCESKQLNERKSVTFSDPLI